MNKTIFFFALFFLSLPSILSAMQYSATASHITSTFNAVAQFVTFLQNIPKSQYQQEAKMGDDFNFYIHNFHYLTEFNTTDLQACFNTLLSQEQLQEFAQHLDHANIPNIMTTFSPSTKQLQLYAPGAVKKIITDKGEKRGTLIQKKSFDVENLIFFDPVNNTIVGECDYYLKFLLPMEGGIIRLHIDKDHRGAGYGSMLLKFALQQLFAEGCFYVILHAGANDLKEGEDIAIMQQKLIEFYRRHGGQHYKKGKDDWIRFKYVSDSTTLNRIW